jgi:hypothetical protein
MEELKQADTAYVGVLLVGARHWGSSELQSTKSGRVWVVEMGGDMDDRAGPRSRPQPNTIRPTAPTSPASVPSPAPPRAYDDAGQWTRTSSRTPTGTAPDELETTAGGSPIFSLAPVRSRWDRPSRIACSLQIYLFSRTSNSDRIVIFSAAGLGVSALSGVLFLLMTSEGGYNDGA